MRPSRMRVLAAMFFVGLGCGGKIASTSEPPFAEDAGIESSAPVPSSRDATVADVADVCVDAIGDEVTSHSCVHGAEGPFETVVLASQVTEAPDTSRLHVAYRLTVPAAAGDGYVSHTPGRDGEHVIFTSRAQVLRVEDDEGGLVPAIHREPVGRCASFETAAVFELREGKRYRVRFKNEAATALAFFEHMGSFGEPWARRCADARRDR
jgi:hypothetical protein